jgi:hypothetical protein
MGAHLPSLQSSFHVGTVKERWGLLEMLKFGLLVMAKPETCFQREEPCMASLAQEKLLIFRDGVSGDRLEPPWTPQEKGGISNSWLSSLLPSATSRVVSSRQGRSRQDLLQI